MCNVDAFRAKNDHQINYNCFNEQLLSSQHRPQAQTKGPRTQPSLAKCTPQVELQKSACHNGRPAGKRSSTLRKVTTAIRLRGNVYNELLCVLFLPNDEVDAYPTSRYKRKSVCPARFLWLRPNFCLKRACVARRGNPLESIRLNSYTFDGNRKILLIHRILGVTFCCPPRLWTARFTRQVEVDHLFDDHGDNRVSRLLCKCSNERRLKRARLAHAYLSLICFCANSAF